MDLLSIGVEVSPAMLSAARHRIAGLAGGRWRVLGTLENGAFHGSEVLAVAQWVKFHAEYRAVRKRAHGDSLLCHRRSSGHFHSPLNVLSIRFLHWPR